MAISSRECSVYDPTWIKNLVILKSKPHLIKPGCLMFIVFHQVEERKGKRTKIFMTDKKRHWQNKSPSGSIQRHTRCTLWINEHHCHGKKPLSPVFFVKFTVFLLLSTSTTTTSSSPRLKWIFFLYWQFKVSVLTLTNVAQIAGVCNFLVERGNHFQHRICSFRRFNSGMRVVAT